MLGARIIAKTLVEQGLRRVFTFPGGTIAPTFDACREEGIEILCARHEQGAGYAALAAARLTGVPQVVLVTSGPGVTNIVTPVADAFYDSTPLIVFTGQVGTGDLLSGRRVRQTGFQQVDAPALLAPVTKRVFQPLSADELPGVLVDAFATAVQGRPGPVVIDLPMDVQRTESSGEPMALPAVSLPVPEPRSGAIREAAQLLAASARPVIFAGQGVLLAEAQDDLRALAERFGIPVAMSLLGLGAYPTAGPLSLGFPGHTGNQYAGRALHEADLVLVLGARLDVRQTGSRTEAFVPNGKVVHVDLDAAELLHARVGTDLRINADARIFLRMLLEEMPEGAMRDLAPWRERVDGWKKRYALEWDDSGALKPQAVIAAVNAATAGRDAVVTSGVGSHQHWAARHFDFDYPKRAWLTSGGHGAMGYDLPSAIGGQLARPDAVAICFVGDGSFQLNMQELQSAIEWKTPVKVFVLDNQRLALVSQFQLFNWEEDPTTGGKTNPDFAAIAKAYGLWSATASTPEELAAAVEGALAADGPAVVHCLVDPNEDIRPMLLGGQTMDAMWPYAE